MGLHRRAPFAPALLLAAATAAFSLAAVEHAAAQFRGGVGGPMAMPRAAMPPTAMPRGALPGASLPRAAMPRGPMVGRFPGRITAWPDGSGASKSHPPRRPDGPVAGDRKPTQDTTRTPRRQRPRGPVIVGPAIGTGVAIGAAGAAAAVPPPPGSPPPSSSAPQAPPSNAGINIPPQNERRFVPNEVLIEFAGNYPAQAIAALARRHRLTRIDSFNLASTNSTYFHGRIAGGRTVRTVLAGLRNETALRAAQANYIYTAAQAVPAALPAQGGDSLQYALAKLRLQEAHSLTRGNDVLVAVIDSGVDAAHPELQGVIAGTFDAVKKADRPHAHGTAMAGTIAARSRLTGVAPAARILAIRAFGPTSRSAEATTAAILRGVDHAIGRNARVINMSFTGPSDPGLGRSLAAARAKGIVLVAAAGNLGEKSPPQYPAADPNVIAVTATDADDRLYSGANRGSHIAVAAPGVDIMVPAPNAAYDITTGTSVAAAHVSGVVALILERKPDADPETVRAILQSSAKDLGPTGKDEQFGAGLTDAYQAVLALDPPHVAAGTLGQAGPGQE